jgi:alkylation response protein AidB-like acyl-CoA dehydrogenase
VGAFDLAMDHARQRSIFGDAIVNFQAKSFEIADLYARIESARLMVHKACWTKDQGRSDFGLHASMAKVLSVEIARQVCTWSADLFGAASTIFEHPIHKYPMDVWGSSLGEGTQDVQKLIIFREVMKRLESANVR